MTFLSAVGDQTPSNYLVAPLVAVVLYLASQRLIRGVATREGDPRLVKLLRWSLFLHLLCAPLQILVVKYAYHGVSDFLQYDHAGSIIADNFRHFDFSIQGSDEGRHLLGDGALSIVTGVVMTFVGGDQLAAFFVFAWFAFLGSVGFYRAYCITFPEANKRRYALMLFFLPSLLFWTASVGKEGIVSLSLGLATYGCAKVLARKKGGYPLILVGGIIGVFVRPNEEALLAGGFAIAMVFRQRDEGRGLKGLRLVGSWIFLAGVLVGVGFLAAKLIHVGEGSLTNSLSRIGKANGSVTTVSGTASVPYSKDPLTYPRDVYEILFNPLPVTAHSLTQLVAAAENTVIIVLIYKSIRNLRCIPRAARQRSYVLLCLVYSLAFFYAFAALGNEGLITRERTLLFPYMLVLMNIPVAPKGQPPMYTWEVRGMKRKDKKKLKRAAKAGAVY